ncbi:MAG: calcium/proton exchanger [Gloeomargarita sp. SKYBB_i_bin120]|nr:calcium/proton exchanger [Gloeomargarita sp. SKYG98]MCS7293208.1 calcium/proton exchanger [Gloeomargarita sp. SKYB120]MDW8178773.1 calcium/proton exchanger [Gloeomargarita sp. SKYBB_i_bin120]
MTVKQKMGLGLLVFLPLSWAAVAWRWGELATCITAGLAIVPLAIWLSTATEELALVMGPTLGGLLNAVFGNATELILALVTLRAGLVEVVKASITGTVVANLLLVLGLAMLLGGLRHKEQQFQAIVPQVNAPSMTLAVMAIFLPTLLARTAEGQGLAPHAIAHLSVVVAAVLMGVYGLTLVFALKTHSYLYDVGVTELGEPHDRPNLWLWLGVLAAATVGVAVESEIFVGVIEEATAQLGLTPLFTGVILLPLLGGAAEYVTAVNVAMKNNMNLAVSVAMGSSALVALLVTPVLVLVGEWWGQPMDLNFNLFEVVAVALAVTVANMISLDGRSNWLEGSLLLASYGVIAVAFYYHPA